jgi:hypothetical protein
MKITTTLPYLRRSRGGWMSETTAEPEAPAPPEPVPDDDGDGDDE